MRRTCVNATASSTHPAVANALQSLWLVLERTNRNWSLGTPTLYVCNCNGLRERDVARAIECGACRPADIFQRNHCAAQCAKCVCEMRQMIQDSREAFALAAE